MREVLHLRLCLSPLASARLFSECPIRLGSDAPQDPLGASLLDTFHPYQAGR